MAGIVESLEKTISGIKALKDRGVDVKGQANYLRSLEDKLAALMKQKSNGVVGQPQDDILNQDPNSYSIIGSPGSSTLKIKVRDENVQVIIIINENTPMAAVKRYFAKQIGVEEQRFGLFFDGLRRIQADDTPKKLGMKDGAVIEVYPVHFGLYFPTFS